MLNVLQSIDTEELVGDEERAKHALLLSMALDKNYIDKTDFEVLQRISCVHSIIKVAYIRMLETMIQQWCVL